MKRRKFQQREQESEKNVRVINNQNETKLSMFCLKILEYLWLFAIFSIPLWMTVNILPTTLKYYVFGIIISIMMIFWLIRMIEIKKFELKLNWLSILVILLLGSVAISTIFSLAPDLSFWGNERRQGLVSFILYTLFFIMVGSSIKKKEQVERIITAIIAAGFLNGLMAILQYYNVNFFATSKEMLMDSGKYRAYAATGNPLFLAGWFVMAIPLTIYRAYDFIKRKSWANYIIYIYLSILILEIIGLFLTFTRGAIAAFVVSFFVGVVLFGFMKKIKWLWITAVIIFIFTIASVISLNISSNPLKIPKNNVITYRFSNILNKNDSFYSRTLLWKLLLKPIREHFWVGVGPDAFGPYSYSKEYFDTELMKYEMSSFQKRLDRAHNIIIDSMLSTGIIGTIILFGIFLYVLFRLFKNISKSDDYKLLSLFLFVAIIGYVIQGMTAFPDVSNYVLLFILFAICYFIFNNIPNESGGVKYIESKTNTLSSNSYWWYLLLIIPIVLFLYLMVYPPYANEAGYYKAIKMLGANPNSQEGKDLLINTWKKNPRLEKPNNAVLGLITNSEDEEKITWFVDELNIMKKKMPEELFFPFMLSYTYHKWGELTGDETKFQLSKQVIDEALESFGNKYQLYTTYIFILSDRCDFKKTDAKIAEAIDFSSYLKGQYYIYAAKGAIACKNIDQAIYYLEQIVNVTDVVSYQEKYSSLGKLYAEKGNIEKAVENWEKCVKVNPTDTACIGNLAIYHANEDRYDEAIRYVEILKKADYKKGQDLYKQITELKKEFESKKSN